MSANTIRQDIVNIPNLLTLFRIALIPVVCALIYDGEPLQCLVAYIFFAVASFTDWLDGYIARKQNLVSMTGKFLDPLADKLLIMAVLIILVALGRVDQWLVILILAREISVTSLRALAAGEGMVIAAGQGGKYKTAFQMLGIVGLIIHYTYELNYFGVIVKMNFHRVGLYFLVLSMVFSFYSAAQYVQNFLKSLPDVPDSAT